MQVFIQSDKRLKGVTAPALTVPPPPPSLPSRSLPPSLLLPSFLPLHSPVTWYSYNPLRHVLMFWDFFFFCCCCLLAVECWHSPTHSFSLSLSLSLNPSLCLFLLSPEKERKRMACRLCGSHYVNLLFVYLFVSVCWFVCVSGGRRRHDDVCLVCLVCLLCSVCTHPSERMYSVRWRVNIVSVCSVLSYGFVCAGVCWVLRAVHSRCSVLTAGQVRLLAASPLSQSSAGSFDLGTSRVFLLLTAFLPAS